MRVYCCALPGSRHDNEMHEKAGIDRRGRHWCGMAAAAPARRDAGVGRCAMYEARFVPVGFLKWSAGVRLRPEREVCRCLPGPETCKSPAQRVAAFPDRLGALHPQLRRRTGPMLPWGARRCSPLRRGLRHHPRADRAACCTGVQRYTGLNWPQGLAIGSFTDASRAAPVIPGARRWCRYAPSHGMRERLRAMPHWR